MTPLAAVVRDGFAIQLVAWAVAAPLRTEKFYDAVGSSTFMWLVYRSLTSHSSQSLRSKVNSGFVFLWAARLGSFLFSRILKDGKDRRFDDVKTRPLKFLMFWLIQGLWCVLTSMPVHIINTNRADSDGEEPPPVGARDLVGWALWVCGFLAQTTADAQKTAFRSVADNHGKFITSGLWSVVQHPNYGGEIAMVRFPLLVFSRGTDTDSVPNYTYS